MSKLMSIINGCFLIFVFCLFPICIKAQSKRLKINNIERVIVLNKKNDNDKLSKQAEKILNKNGDYVEEIEYKSDGTIEAKTTYKYDNLNNLIEKADYVLDKKSESKDLKLKEKRIFMYNGFNELSEEAVYIEDNKVDKKYVYAYNNKGLVVGRKTYDLDNKLVGEKSYLYEPF
jgi:hypothetical protein